MSKSLLEVACIGTSQRVTAIKLVAFDDPNNTLVLISGLGSRIVTYIYGNEEWMKISDIEALPHRVVHGIVSGDGGVCAVFGQKAVIILRLSLSRRPEVVVPVTEYNDWILDILWFTDMTKYAFVTTHNKIYIADSSNGVILNQCSSTLNCILYSAKLLHPPFSNVVCQLSDISVAAGTVFNQVMIWNCEENVKLSNVTSQLSGHKGVIFGIEVRYEFKVMTTVSDDRTIHLWRWSYRDGKPADWRNAEFTLQQVFLGHTARVWKSLISTDYIISVGEDAQIISWNYDGTIKKKTRAHKGKNVWSIDLLNNFLATGSGDHSVKVWNLEQVANVNKNHDDEKIFTVFRNDGRGDDFPRSLCIGNNFCLELSECGVLKCFNLDTAKEEILFRDDCFSGYTVMSSMKHRGALLVALGNSTGTLRLLKLTYNRTQHFLYNWIDVDIADSKVMSITWVKSADPTLQVYDVPLVLITDTSGKMTLCKVNPAGNEHLKIHVCHLLHLPKSKQRYVVCCCIYESSNRDIYFICSDKVGTIHVYDLMTELHSESQTEKLLPLVSYPKTHGKTGVTDMCVHQDHIYTAGRDGFFRQYKVKCGSLVLQNETRVQKGFDWLGRLYFDAAANMFVAGFCSTHFVIYDVSINQFIMRVDCGGGHRNWDLIHDDKSTYFGFIKNKTTWVAKTVVSQPYVQLRPSLHGSKITGCTWMTLGHLDYFITCSDDTFVRISKIKTSENSLSEVTDVHTAVNHISSIKCMSLTDSKLKREITCNSRVLFTGGGRAQLMATLIQQDDDCLNTSYLANTNVTSKLTRRQLRHNIPDPETRIMTISCLTSPLSCSHLHLLALGCSDGILRFTAFDEEKKRFLILNNLAYQHSHCILTSRFHKLKDGGLLFIGATNGKILIFSWSDSLLSKLDSGLNGKRPHHTDESNLEAVKPVFELTHHQSGVNALHICAGKANNLAVFSGGDDNSLSVTELNLFSWGIEYQFSSPSQHSAQITGIAEIDCSNIVASCSIDQRIYFWKSQGSDFAHTDVVTTRFTTVPDVTGIAYNKSRGILAVVGEGLELFKLDLCKF